MTSAKPLIRGVTLDVGDEVQEKMKWCPLVYEYLPDFCYTCGLIGHTDRLCAIQLQKRGAQQFSRALRFIPEKKRFGEEFRGKLGVKPGKIAAGVDIYSVLTEP